MKTLPLLTLCGLVALTAPRANASALLKPTSGVTQALSAKSLSVETHLRGAFARTTVTTVYSNPNNEQIEADFLYSAPKGSVVTGFAYWYGKEKVIARVVEKGRAAKIYQYITSRMRDPALIEMVGKNAFRARIFPVEARNDLKIEIQLAQTLPQTKDGPLWTYPLREETRNGALQDVSIHVHSATATSSNMGAFKNGELQVTKRNFSAKDDFRALVQQKPAPIRASLLAARDGGTDGFFALSLTPTSPLIKPAVKISGVATYEVLVPKVPRLAAGQAFVVTGRYRGSGRALVALGGQSFEVVFPDAVEKNNLASSLWAANRIESLSENAANEKKVMELSKRFGVPSKWTSWLAIPEEERINFKRQMWASDRSDAARAYAQALARGDAGGAKAQKVVFDDLTAKLKADGPNYAEEEELQPLSSYLNDELRRVQKAVVQARYEGKVSKSQQAQWKTWASNLRKAGADDGGNGVELPVYVVEDELRIASRLYMQEIEVGRSKGRKARALKARLKELAATKVAQNYGWDETSFLDEAAGVRANALAMDIAATRAATKIDRKRERQLLARLKRLEAGTDIDTDEMLNEALQTVWGGKVEAAAQKWAREIEAGRADGATARKFEREVRALQKRSGLRDIPALDSAWQTLAAKTALGAAPSIRAQGPSGTAAKKLNSQITAIAKRAGKSRAELSRHAWNQVGVNVATELAKEITAGRSESSRATQLQSQLQLMKKKYRIDEPYQVRSAWDQVENKIAAEYVKEIEAKRENGPRAKQLQAKLADVSKHSNQSSQYMTREAWFRRASESVKERLNEIASHGDNSKRAKELEKQIDTFATRSGRDVKQVEQQTGYELLNTYHAQIGEEIAGKREDGTKAKELRDQRERLLAHLPSLKGSYYYNSLENVESFAWEGRAHESAYRLLEAQKAGEGEKVPPLQEELDMAVQKADKSKDAVLNWEKTRLAKNEPLISATDYRLRPGDPLISVLAPKECRQVLAVMPDGTLLPLRYDEQKGAWEARFDVPAGAAQGDYKVQILIVAPDGSRKRLVMNFAVDMVAPRGTASLQSEQGHWKLRLETDEQTDRVSAFLPWNERVELRRDVDGIFTAQVAVPQKTMGAAKVRFILTDKAHNRTEVLVDWE